MKDEVRKGVVITVLWGLAGGMIAAQRDHNELEQEEPHTHQDRPISINDLRMTFTNTATVIESTSAETTLMENVQLIDWPMISDERVMGLLNFDPDRRKDA